VLKKIKIPRNILNNFLLSHQVFFLCFILIGTIGTSCNNFHEVTPGVLYRSDQLSGKQFDHFIKKHQITTVINLRGASPDAQWYQDELNITQKDSVAHIDIHLSAMIYVSSQDIDSIIDVAMSTKKPILVHCQGGADRTGLFCAAWKLKIEHAPTEKASKQLSFIYGHIHILKWSGTRAMDSSFNDYVQFYNKQYDTVTHSKWR
jgi:protein tyrosine/serine phosphatase